MTTRLLVQMWKQKIFQKSRNFAKILARKFNKKFFAQPRSYLCTIEMQSVIRRQALEEIFQVMTSPSKLSQRAATMEKNDVNLKSSLARSPFCDRAYPEKPTIASPGHPVGVMPSLLHLFVQQDKKFLDVFRKFVLTILRNESSRKIDSESQLTSKPTNDWLICSAIQMICITSRTAEHDKL